MKLRNVISCAPLLIASLWLTGCGDTDPAVDDGAGGASSEPAEMGPTYAQTVERLRELEALTKQLSELVEDVEASLEKAESEATATQASYDASLAKNDELKESLSEAKASIAALQAQLTAAGKDVTDLEADKASLTALLAGNAETFLEQIDDLRAELDATKADLLAAGFPVKIRLNHTVDGVDLVRRQDFALSSGGSVSVSEIRYWISNVELVSVAGASFAVPNSYYLVEDAPQQTTHSNFVRPANKRTEVILPSIPGDTYRALRFSVGVDSTYNDNLSLQAGELHVLSNMARVSWMWFSSYIFTKVSGSYTPEGGAATAFQWDTGSNDSYRTVELDLPSSVDTSVHGAVEVALTVELEALLEPFLTSFPATIGQGTVPAMATRSDAYQGAFSIYSVVD